MTTVITDDRKAALAVGYIATDWTSRITYAEYKRLMADWLVRAIVCDGVCIGAVYSRGGEVHVSVVRNVRGKWATRGLINQIFSGNSKTKVAKGHDYMVGILKRLGMVEDDHGYFHRAS